MSIQERLFALADARYREFTADLTPTLPRERFIGVRTPALRKLAKELCGGAEAEAFLAALPHTYFEENQLHAFLLGEMRDFSACLAAVNIFLPYVDNWATCDQLSPKVLAKELGTLEKECFRWIASGETYMVRFGMGMLMRYFLDERFDGKYLETVASVRSEEYYIQMMQAWYFATALAKQYTEALVYLTDGKLEKWVHNKTIQKAVESYRITDAQKAYLKTLRK